MKFKSFLASHKLLVKDVVTSTCLLGGTAGIVFGISAGTFKVEYMDLSNAEKRLYASENNSYLSQDIQSGWNMKVRPDGDVSDHYIDMPGKTSVQTPWDRWHPDASGNPFASPDMLINTPEGTKISPEAQKARKEYNSIIIDGATHTVMDRSFNQSMFEGFADFNTNTKNTNYDSSNVNSYKPSQDNTTDFINTYTSVMRKHKVLGLAGFNHATPLSAMMTHKKLPDGFDDPYATCANIDDTKIAERTAFVLLDANIPDNQNIASVQFRADQPGFLTGMATCSYLIHNLNLYHDHYQDLSVAAYGGVPIPTVTVYMGGFQRGVELFNYTVIYNCTGLGQEVGVGASMYFGAEQPLSKPNGPKCKETFEMLIEHSKYKKDVKEILDDTSKPTPEEKVAAYIEQGLPTKLYNEFSVKMIKLGDLSNHFSGTFAAGDAIGITKQYLNRGASAIVAVAGPQSLDSAQEIQNQNSKSIVIGVDTAMENSDYQRYHKGFSKNSNPNEKSSDAYWDTFKDKSGNYSSESHAIIKFSAIKDLKAVTEKITRLVATGGNWDVSKDDRPDPRRAICGTGFQTCANILNGLVSISWDGFVPLMDALEHLVFENLNNNFLSLDMAWAASVEHYKSMIIGEEEWNKLPADYRNAVSDLSKICTYNKYNDDGSESSLYQNYNHTMGILGQLMDTFMIKFINKTSLRPVAPSDLSRGFEIIPENDSETFTILEWLRYNMYLTC